MKPFPHVVAEFVAFRRGLLEERFGVTRADVLLWSLGLRTPNFILERRVTEFIEAYWSELLR